MLKWKVERFHSISQCFKFLLKVLFIVITLKIFLFYSLWLHDMCPLSKHITLLNMHASFVAQMFPGFQPLVFLFLEQSNKYTQVSISCKLHRDSTPPTFRILGGSVLYVWGRSLTVGIRPLFPINHCQLPVPWSRTLYQAAGVLALVPLSSAFSPWGTQALIPKAARGETEGSYTMVMFPLAGKCSHDLRVLLKWHLPIEVWSCCLRL